MQLPSLQANPGGQLGVADVVGREKLVRRFWRALERQSVVLSAERRIGKTSICMKMKNEPQAGFQVQYQTLEGVRTPVEFVEGVVHSCRGMTSSTWQIRRNLKSLLSSIGGMEIAGVFKFPETSKPAWKEILARLLSELCQADERRHLFFWDEFPLMLYDIQKNCTTDAATEILDVLRSLRNRHANLRMVFTGSVGLANLISSFKGGGYANDPTNDMLALELPPLARGDAEALACRLIVGEKIESDNPARLAECFAEESDNVPFYIHHIAAALSGQRASSRDVRDLVSEALVAPHDPWHMKYYRERLDSYYEQDAVRIVLAILDTLACEEAGLSFAELFEHVKACVVVHDTEEIRRLLGLLTVDHYLARKNGGYCFRFGLIRRFWSAYRNLHVVGGVR